MGGRHNWVVEDMVMPVRISHKTTYGEVGVSLNCLVGELGSPARTTLGEVGLSINWAVGELGCHNSP